jgi:hypothetical protein
MPERRKTEMTPTARIASANTPLACRRSRGDAVCRWGVVGVEDAVGSGSLTV